MSRAVRARAQIELHEDLEALRADWQVLGQASKNPFLSWEWASLWWAHEGQGRPLRVQAVRGPDGAVRCIAPLFLATRRPLRVLRLIGHSAGDVCGPVAAAGDDFAAEALREALSSTSGWDVFLADRVPARDRWAPALAGRSMGTEPCPEIQNVGGWAAFLRTRSRHFRQHTGNLRRRLEARYEAEFRLATAHTLEEDLDALFRLHDARWGAASSFTLLRPFHEQFARSAAEDGRLRLWVLHLDGVPAAALYAVRFGGDEWYYQSGRDPSYDAVGAGAVLFAHSVAEALDAGVGSYRLLRGAEPYKLRFATATPELETVAVGRGPVGRAAVLAAGAAGRGVLRGAARAVRLEVRSGTAGVSARPTP